MKKIITFITACSLLFAAAMLSGCAADASADTGDGGGENNGGGTATDLYVNCEGFDIAPWDNWDSSNHILAEVTNGADGGIRLTDLARNDTGTYFGVNVAAGSNSGATADINGKGFTQIKCKIRGNVAPAYCSIYIIDSAGTEIGKTTKLSTYVSTLSETDWTEITVTGLTSTAAMKSALTFFCDNDGAAIGDWIEIKNIDFLDANGLSVSPAYITD